MKKTIVNSLIFAALIGAFQPSFAVEDQYQIKLGVEGLEPTEKSKPFYVSCDDIKKTKPKSTSGTFVIDVDGPTGAIAPMNVYCDMETMGGGWTLTYKQTSFQTGDALAVLKYASPLLQTPAFNGTTWNGNIAANVPHKEYMLYASPTLNLVFDGRFAKYTGGCVNGRFCTHVSSAKSVTGIANKTNLLVNYLHHTNHSSIILGYAQAPYDGQPWCIPLHGRYDGGCTAGGRGNGNWLIYVR
ncbi:fibrinogen-like YCDxxxxGGGW domain-containing protein [Aeromonas veronii]|uniref:Fibrinogen C-terminal domain-containing protein n=1 Tax=Aeromonas veronii TaxID=654 RepID=A0A2T4MWB6_AERVE|nr:fibrinogen-like YCDxxxxGGGW domain-containing protein [Aeromonas veronii]PTH78887.1 hypothetical protein DAA48_20815 [Aeromonas veronii]